MQKRLVAIAAELRAHAPFTLFGAATGIACMLLFRNAGPSLNHRLFQVFHPAHVVLSAIVTASLFKLYEKKANLVKIVFVGYVGAIGVATLSDCIVPFLGEDLLGVAVPVHSHQHEHDHDAAAPNIEEHADEDDHVHVAEDGHDHEPAEEGAHEHVTDEVHARAHGAIDSVRHRLHLGFIEDWYIVNPAAILGIIIAYFWPRTSFPHAGHVLISTWASSFHVLMNTHQELSATMLIGVFVVLFIAVWLPCCISDIVFPLLFVKSAPLCIHGKPIEECPS